MDFPELTLNDLALFKDCDSRIERICISHPSSFLRMLAIGRSLKAQYHLLDEILERYTQGICSHCNSPCCVNRHGFPDFEDLVAFKAMGVKTRSYDKGLSDRGKCQFLGPMGCKLKRFERPYRCTWYFCDKVMDEFFERAPVAFLAFEAQMKGLSMKRQGLISIFEGLLCDDFLKECKKNNNQLK